MSSAMPYVLQTDFLSVVFDGRSYPINRSHPMFKKLQQALLNKKWKEVPALISLAKQLSEQSHGKVSVTADGVFYRGQKVDNTLTAKIIELMEHQKPVSHMLRFMDNLYMQPDPATVNEVYLWLANGRFALTDDGCFLAYKKVREDYKDIHSGTLDNHVGQVVMMPREEVDPDRRNECSRGLHFCSKRYLPRFGNWKTGNHIMEVKVNPADVVAIPQGYGNSKGRTWLYEVLREVMPHEMIEGVTDSPVMMRPVIEIAKERSALILQVKALPSIKRLIKSGRLTDSSFKKASNERLTSWVMKFTKLDIAPSKSKLFDNPLVFIRQAAGMSVGEIAKLAGLPLKDIYNAERALRPEQSVIDKVIKAVETAQGNYAGTAYPRPSVRKATSVYTGSTPYRDDGEENLDD